MDVRPTYRPRVLIFLVLLVALFTGLGVAQAATPNDTECRKLVSSAKTHSDILAYDACRFDKLDEQVSALKAGSTTSPSPSATTAPPTVTASPTPTVEPTTATPKPTPSATAIPTVTPSPTASATVPPSSGDKPGATNTGVPAGTTLTTYSGPKTITVAGTVIDSKDIPFALSIQAKNVVIKNSKIHGSGGTGVATEDSGSLTISDSEIYGFEVGLTYTNFKAIRVNLHDLSFDGMKLSSNASIVDSWIHAPKPTADAHWDGIQVQNGVVNTLIQNNTIDASGAGTNSALFLCPDLGPSTNGPLTVVGNYLSGGNYTVNVLDGNNGQYFISTIIVRDNTFVTRGQYGFSNVNVPITQSGNKDATGKAYTL